MRIVNPKLLAELRKRPCDVCGAAPPSQVEHVFRRGQGDARRIDALENCLSICAECHVLAENVPGRKLKMIELLAQLNRTTTQSLREWVWLIWRLPKGSPVPLLRKIPAELDSTKEGTIPF